MKEFFEKASATCSDFEVSPACRYFTHEDGKLTARTATRSTKYTTARPKASSTHLNSLSDNGIIWELQERIDSFNIRYESLKEPSKSIDSFINLYDLCKIASGDIVKTVKIYYPDLSQVFASFTETVFKLIKDLIDFNDESKQKLQFVLNEMAEKQRKVVEKCLNLQIEIEEMNKIRKFEEGEIEAEMNSIFPDTTEEVNSFKERVKLMRELRPEGTSVVLKDVYRDMSQERKMPDDPVADYSDMDPELIIQGIKGNYQVIISKTIKNVKKGLNVSMKKSNISVQTEGNYIDPKSVEDLNKTLEKAHAQYQSLSYQYERSKIDIKTLQENNEKNELDKSSLRVDLISTKKDLENKFKEVNSMRLDMETKKSEIVILQKISNEKDKEIENLKFKLKVQEKMKKEVKEETKEEIGKIVENLQKKEKKNKRLEIIEEKKEKSSSLSAVTRSGLTVREELEKEYSFQLRRNSVKPPELEVPKPPSRGRPDTAGTPKTPTKTPTKSPLYQENLISHSLDNSTQSGKVKSITTEAISLNVSRGKKSKNLKKKLIEETSHFSVRVAEKSGKGKGMKKNKVEKIKVFKVEEENKEDCVESPIGLSRNFRSESRTKGVSTGDAQNEVAVVKVANKEDKCCGLDIRADVSIGIQVGEELEKSQKNTDFKLRAINPNNLYGLRGDVFYQASQFVAQPKIPDMQTPYKPDYMQIN